MKRIFVTFGDDKFAKARDFGVKMAKFIGGFDISIGYSFTDIPNDFIVDHQEIFNIKRGAGLWLWKPFVIYKALTEIADDGDMVFYADGGSFFIRNVKNIEKRMGDQNIWVSWLPFVEYQFTKADAFDLMDCNKEEIKNSAQIQASFIYIRKNSETIRFIKDWLFFCCDINILHPDNIWSGRKNCPDFIAHREDQTVLSLLCKKRGIVPHMDPSQFGKFPHMYGVWGFKCPQVNYIYEYPVCIILHRRPVIKFKETVKLLMFAIIPRMIIKKIIRPQKVSEEKRNMLKH